jgi:HK97 family phage prohead protease
MEKILKVFRAEVKSVNEEDFSVVALVSTKSIDRDGESILPEAFKKRLKIYKDHPVLLSSHRYDKLTQQIGMAEAVKVTDEGLEAKFKYFVGQGNQEADWGFNLVKNGVGAYSVGFIAHAWEDQPINEDTKAGKKPYRVYTDVELIEVSQVLIPSNRDALSNSLSAEGVDPIEKEMCELAIKSFFPEKKEEAPVESPKENQEEKLFEAVQAKLLADQSFIEKLAECIAQKLSEKKSYFDELFSKAGGSPEAELKKEEVGAMLKNGIQNVFKKKE